jgi:hypothetical protein
MAVTIGQPEIGDNKIERAACSGDFACAGRGGDINNTVAATLQ